MEFEKEHLKLKLMGYEVLSVCSMNGFWQSLVVKIDTDANFIDVESRSTPYPTKHESVEKAIKDFNRFNHLMKQHGF